MDFGDWEQYKGKSEDINTLLYYIFSKILPSETTIGEVEQLAQLTTNRVTELAGQVEIRTKSVKGGKK